MLHNQKAIVSTGGGSPADTGKAHTTAAAGNSVSKQSGIPKPTWEDQFVDGLRRAGSWAGHGRPHYVSDRTIRRAAERKLRKLVKKGGVK